MNAKQKILMLAAALDANGKPECRIQITCSRGWLHRLGLRAEATKGKGERGKGKGERAYLGRFMSVAIVSNSSRRIKTMLLHALTTEELVRVFQAETPREQLLLKHLVESADSYDQGYEDGSCALGVGEKVGRLEDGLSDLEFKNRRLTVQILKLERDRDRWRLQQKKKESGRGLTRRIRPRKSPPARRVTSKGSAK
jgi:hypothetical protein